MPGNLKQISVEDFENENRAVEGEVIGELLLDPSGISSSSNLRRTLREQSPVPATCNSRSGQHFKSTITAK